VPEAVLLLKLHRLPQVSGSAVVGIAADVDAVVGTSAAVVVVVLVAGAPPVQLHLLSSEIMRMHSS